MLDATFNVQVVKLNLAQIQISVNLLFCNKLMKLLH